MCSWGQDTAGLALSPWLCLPSASSFTAWPFTALHGGSDGGKGLAAGWVPAPCLLQEPGCSSQLLQRAGVSPSSNNTEKEARKIKRFCFPSPTPYLLATSGCRRPVSCARASFDRAKLSCLFPGHTKTGQSPHTQTQVKHLLSFTCPQSRRSQQPRLRPHTLSKGLLAGQANIPRTDQHPFEVSRSRLKLDPKHACDTGPGLCFRETSQGQGSKGPYPESGP